MGIIWIDEGQRQGSVTLYATNITLNSVSAIPFEHVEYARVGVDPEEGKLIIQPIPNEDLERNDVAKSTRYIVASKKSYARISSSILCASIGEQLGLRLGKDPLKFPAQYIPGTGLVVDIKKGGNQ